MRVRVIAATAAAIAVIGFGAIAVTSAGAAQPANYPARVVTNQTPPPPPTVIPPCGTPIPGPGLVACRITDKKKIAQMLKQMEETPPTVVTNGG